MNTDTSNVENKDAAQPGRDVAIADRKSELDLSDSASVIGFGSSAQQGLQSISREMLSGVRNKDIGPAGDGLNRMVTALRGFTVSDGDLSEERGLWAKLVRRATPLAQFKARFDTVQQQIGEISLSLEQHQNALIKDLAALDRLYDETLNYFHGLELYIEAGSQHIAEIDAETIPAKRAEMEAAEDGKAMILANELRELQSFRDDLDRRVHDMKLSRQVAMQSLPSIRLVQENDKSLITKITSTLTNTVPAWETQLAQAMTIQRAAAAAAAVSSASDLTNELLASNATNLRMANANIRKEMERGIYDIDAIRKANEELIGTIEDSLQIAEEGKARRAEAEAELVQMEGELRSALVKTRAERESAKAEGLVAAG